MHQDSSRQPADEAVRRSLRAIAVGSYVFQCEVAGRLGLHPTDLQAIHRLGMARGGLTAGALGGQLGLTSGATTTAIDRLVEKGLAERRADPTDGRRARIHLLPSAGRLLRRQYHHIDARIDTAIAMLDPDEVAIVARFLERISVVGHNPESRPSR